MSKECANATLHESLASRVQMSGEPSNGSRSSATPVTVRVATESAQSAPQLIKKRVQQNLTASMRKTSNETGIALESDWTPST